MTDTLPRTRWQSINATPLRDLLRGRVTGRLDWRRRLIAADLSDDAKRLIADLVRATRLWRIEKAAVADELIAHFADARAAGVTNAAAAFGDAKAAAKLIRRAKIRNRPVAWHALRFATRTVYVLAAVVALLAVRFYLGRPNIAVDYVAALNARLAGVPEQDRAWPLYRLALIDMLEQNTDPYKRWGDLVLPSVIEDAKPGDEAWPAFAAWLDQHRAATDLILRGAARPQLGFVLGPGGSSVDPPLDWREFTGPRNYAEGMDERFLIQTLLPHLNYVRSLALVAAGEARLARERDDPARFEQCTAAIHSLARQLRPGVLVQQMVAGGIDSIGLDLIVETLQVKPQLLDDAAWQRLAHRVAGDRFRYDFVAERMMFDDLLQRSFTDDGDGDGRLARNGLHLITGAAGLNGFGQTEEQKYDVPLALALIASRRDQVERYERIMADAEVQFAKPGHDADWSSFRQAWHDLRRTNQRLVYLPVFATLPPMDILHDQQGRITARTDGLLIGISLELFHRHHGRWPGALAELSPRYLPSVPVDRVTGGPLRYVVRDGRPRVYGVGVDRDDDGGRPVAPPARPRGKAPRPTDPPDGDEPMLPTND